MVLFLVAKQELAIVRKSLKTNKNGIFGRDNRDGRIDVSPQAANTYLALSWRAAAYRSAFCSAMM